MTEWEAMVDFVSPRKQPRVVVEFGPALVESWSYNQDHCAAMERNGKQNKTQT